MSHDRLDFSHRAYLTEWMDEPCSYEEFRDCLRDLEKVNRLVGAYPPTLEWLEQFAAPGGAPLHIVDVGCGGGDMLRRIEAWSRKHGIAVRLTGIDLNPYAARAAREFTLEQLIEKIECLEGDGLQPVRNRSQFNAALAAEGALSNSITTFSASSEDSAIEWVTGDAFSYHPATEVDLVISSLFTHHLLDAEIVRFLGWMEQTARRGWFINDLHRERVPYYGFMALAWVMRWHRFVRHDGPVSIRRSFRCVDWEQYCAAAGLGPSEVRIQEVRPARLCVSRVRGFA